MIYITGDTHGYLDSLLERLEKYDLSPKDTVIVCGDFGFVWGGTYHNAILDELSKLDYTICFVDGNHENFELLNMYPIEQNWHGGMIHRVEHNIIHLMRGQIYEIDGKTFFTFGGAYSRDRYMRRRSVSWWEEEIPTSENYKVATSNLERVNYCVNYVLTHQIPLSIIYKLNHVPYPDDRELTGFFEWLYSDSLAFDKWFAGHWHINQTFDGGRMNIMLDEVVAI